MGNDGGSIAGRAELVRSKKKEVRVESEMVARFRAQYCALTKQRLRKPVAACKVGYLYNYAAVIQANVDKSVPEQFKHLKKLKNVKEINVTVNTDTTSEFPFICPISQTSLNGKNKFLVLWSCGCVFNEKIIKDLGVKGLKCPLCTKPYNKEDIVELCPTNEEGEIRRAILFQQIQLKKDTQKQQQQQQQQQNGEEVQIKKKVCNEKNKKSKHCENKLEKLATNSNTDLQDNQLYKSLFHTAYKLEDNLFTRNVRFGIR